MSYRQNVCASTVVFGWNSGNPKSEASNAIPFLRAFILPIAHVTNIELLYQALLYIIIWYYMVLLQVLNGFSYVLVV